MKCTDYILPFESITIHDLALVGGKNASLGEMFNQLRPKGIGIPNGYAITAEAYRYFIRHNSLEKILQELLLSLDTANFTNLAEIGKKARAYIAAGNFPADLISEIELAYAALSKEAGVTELDVAVRSSATAEDLPTASFAGRMESYLNIRGKKALTTAVHRCFASLFTDRAIKYRVDMGFADKEVYLSVGIQQMVRSDLSSSGVAFTLDPDTGFDKVVVINGIWGLGENIVQGRVTPDEFIVYKPFIKDTAINPILRKKVGAKEYTMVYKDNPAVGEEPVYNINTPQDKKMSLTLTYPEIRLLAIWCLNIEEHYGKAMDIEWAKDGITGKLFIVQARPETVQGKKHSAVQHHYSLNTHSNILCEGIALGDKVTTGKARLLKSPEEGHLMQPGEILVTDITNPDWDAVLKKAGAIVTNKGGRTSHAAIVARELGTVAIVGSGNATSVIPEGSEITVACCDGPVGHVYEGKLEFEIKEQDISKLPVTNTSPMLILADPGRAFEYNKLPQKGVGLMRLEFAITNSVSVHPLALCHPEKVLDPDILRTIETLTQGFPDKKEYFIDKLSEAVAVVAAAFYPDDVIVRLSDFKSNEYANLPGGQFFEPQEENPMIGLRGAARYYSTFYREAFALECLVMKRVRDTMGMKNVKLMIPFCRTPEEGIKVLEEMAKYGLQRGSNGLQVYVMVEIPSNVLLAEQFADLFDGFSIGSNDLTQLTLGLDRDSTLVSYLFDENNPAVKELISRTIQVAKKKGIKVGLCGQAPSDWPEFAGFLVNEGIDSVSFNPDALIRGIENIYAAEQKKHK